MAAFRGRTERIFSYLYNMSFNPNIHHRKSIRLKGYDYSQAGLYFITICVQNRECLFGKIVDGELVVTNNYSPLRSPSKTIGSIVRGYKIGVTKWFRIHSDIGKIWQHNYYENIIRDEQSHHRISEYIINNPTNWKGDTFHPF